MFDETTDATTYSAVCDLCEYRASTLSTDDDSAVRQLAEDLAAHNQQVHDQPTDVDTILEPVRGKMVRG